MTSSGNDDLKDAVGIFIEKEIDYARQYRTIREFT